MAMAMLDRKGWIRIKVWEMKMNEKSVRNENEWKNGKKFDCLIEMKKGVK